MVYVLKRAKPPPFPLAALRRRLGPACLCSLETSSLVWTRPGRGSIGFINESLGGCVASTGFAVLTQVNDAVVSPEYLWAFLRTQAALLQMEQRSSGGNYPAISENELKKVLILVPSRDVRNRIVAEVARRRAEAFRLRAEAASIWSDAQATFALALLGRPGRQGDRQVWHQEDESET